MSGPFHADDLPRLRRRFAVEVKRNLFEAYQAAADNHQAYLDICEFIGCFPGGEAFHFSFSPNGIMCWRSALLAYSCLI
jgi:hypothetical protein